PFLLGGGDASAADVVDHRADRGGRSVPGPADPFMWRQVRGGVLVRPHRHGARGGVAQQVSADGDGGLWDVVGGPCAHNGEVAGLGKRPDPELLVGFAFGSGSAAAAHAVHWFGGVGGQRPAVVEVGDLGAVGELDAEPDELRDDATVVVAELE